MEFERAAMSSSGADALRPGMVVAGRYRLDRVLGHGGMGLVWAARHEVTRKQVALKVLRDGSDPVASRRRFAREGRAICAVQHPNVVEVYDFLELDDGTLAMTMELLTGESLGDRLERQEQLSAGETADLLLPVMSAVGAAHTRGIVHRDLKPENIFLHVGRDGAIVVKVLDFGVAKITSLDLATTNSIGLTGTGDLLGTPMYMSPEQVFGEEKLDCRSDIWSLGVILYQCLSGILPTRADTIGQVLKLVVAARILPLKDVAPEVPEELTDIVTSMLSRKRERRPDHLGPVIEVLKHYSDVQVPPFTAPGQPRAPCIPVARDLHERLVSSPQVATVASTRSSVLPELSPSAHTARLATQTGEGEPEASNGARRAKPLKNLALTGAFGVAIATAFLLGWTHLLSRAVPTAPDGASGEPDAATASHAPSNGALAPGVSSLPLAGPARASPVASSDSSSRANAVPAGSTDFGGPPPASTPTSSSPSQPAGPAPLGPSTGQDGVTDTPAR